MGHLTESVNAKHSFCPVVCVWSYICERVLIFTHSSSLLLISLVLDSVFGRELYQNKHVSLAGKAIYELSVSMVCRLTWKCVYIFWDVYVCVYMSRQGLSPGPNLGLRGGAIRFLLPPTFVRVPLWLQQNSRHCVSAHFVRIEVCVCVKWQVTWSAVSNKQLLTQFQLSLIFAPQM